MADITEYISGSIISKFETLDGKPRREIVIAYVEGDDDVPFWTHVFSVYSKYFFKVTPNNAYMVNGNYPNGKTALLNIRNLHKNKIICVDADLDLIVGKYSLYSKNIQNNPYIINTQFYAIENVLSQAPLLKNVVNIVTGENTKYDFDRFLKSFSNVVADFFLLYIASIKGKCMKFSLEDLKECINNLHPNSKDFENELTNFKQEYHSQFKEYFIIHKNSMIQYKQRLKALGYKERDIYKLLQGHTLYNSIIRELLYSLCNKILKERLNSLILSNAVPNYVQLKKQVYGFLDSYDNKLRNCIDSAFENNEYVKYYIPVDLKFKLDNLYK